MKRSTKRMTRRSFAACGFSALASLGVSGRALAQGQPVLRKPIPPEVEQANVALVNAFCAAWGKKDMNTLSASLADNCTFRVNQNRPAIVGKKAVVDRLEEAVKRGVEFKVLKTVVLGPLVVNERDDVFAAAGDQPARVLRIHAGMFFVVDGKIVEWTDYSV